MEAASGGGAFIDDDTCNHCNHMVILIRDVDGMEERLEKVKAIIVRQFDVELLHKWREVRILEEEVERGSQLREMLEKLVLNGTDG